MENTNNIINDEIKPKGYILRHKNALVKLIMKDIKILNYLTIKKFLECNVPFFTLIRY